MTISNPPNRASRSFAGDLLYAVRYYLGGRIGLVAVAAAALGLGAYYNWGWLVAVGLAPIILAALPCAAMCALGLCMGGRSKSQADKPTSAHSSPQESIKQPPLRLGASPTDSQESSAASDQPAPKKSRSHKGCC